MGSGSGCGYCLKDQNINIPDIADVTRELVLSSRATLAFNSPGAEGFGVKRAGLAIPESVMLIVSPACCGRNTSSISRMEAYRGRYFYLQMDEADLVTGRHLKLIPRAVEEIVEHLSQRGKTPSIVMVCATCADALLGTDWVRVLKKAEEKTGVRVKPCYMYALTREGLHPPMVHVRQSIYSILEKKEKDKQCVNLLGFFAPVTDDFELYRYLTDAGVQRINELSRCADFDEFMDMARAGLNIVLNPEARSAADDLAKKLDIPYVELKRFYDPDRVHRQYQAFSQAVGIRIDDSEDYEKTLRLVTAFHERHPSLNVAIGECVNADPYELALALSRRGARVREIFAPKTEESRFYIRRLREMGSDARVYVNQDMAMTEYEPDEEVELAIGKDACVYHAKTERGSIRSGQDTDPERGEAPGHCPREETACMEFNTDVQPFGYAGIRQLYAEMEELSG